MYGDVERVADEGALLLLRGGGGGRVVQEGQREEVGVVGVLAAGGDAELFARRGDVREGDPGGAVGGFGVVEGVAVAGLSRKRRAKREGAWLSCTALSTDWERMDGWGGPRRCRRTSWLNSGRPFRWWKMRFAECCLALVV